MYYIFTFRSRTNAMKFYDALLRERVSAALINTPRAAGIGCGLSVKVSDYQSAQRVFMGGYPTGGYPSFHAVFVAENQNGLIKLSRM